MEEDDMDRPSTKEEDYPGDPFSPSERRKLRKMIAAADSATFLWVLFRSISLWVVAVLGAVASWFTIPWPWRKG